MGNRYCIECIAWMVDRPDNFISQWSSIKGLERAEREVLLDTKKNEGEPLWTTVQYTDLVAE